MMMENLRDRGAHLEVQARLDAMKQGGRAVGQLGSWVHLGLLFELCSSHQVNITEACAVNACVITIDHGLTCRAAYVGVNTWDLMDKSRDIGARPEVQARLDAMKQGGWAVGRTWGFSLGTGLVNSPVGQVVADPTKILEVAPGLQPSDSFQFPTGVNSFSK